MQLLRNLIKYYVFKRRPVSAALWGGGGGGGEQTVVLKVIENILNWRHSIVLDKSQSVLQKVLLLVALPSMQSCLCLSVLRRRRTQRNP